MYGEQLLKWNLRGKRMKLRQIFFFSFTLPNTCFSIICTGRDRVDNDLWDVFRQKNVDLPSETIETKKLLVLNSNIKINSHHSHTMSDFYGISSVFNSNYEKNPFGFYLWYLNNFSESKPIITELCSVCGSLNNYHF